MELLTIHMVMGDQVDKGHLFWQLLVVVHLEKEEGIMVELAADMVAVVEHITETAPKVSSSSATPALKRRYIL